MKKLHLATLFLLIGMYAMAQTPQVLFYGYVEEGIFVDPSGDAKKSRKQKNPEKLRNVTVYVYQGDVLINTVSGRESGFYAVLLESGAKYNVTFEKDGFFCKSFEVDCRNVQFPETDAAMKCLTDVSLFKKVEDEEMLALCHVPFAKCSFKNGDMVWDVEYTERAKEKFYELAQPYYMASGK